MAAKEDPSCLFCAIIAGRVLSHKVYETEEWVLSHKVYETEECLAFLDIMPTTEGHTQVIPKYHAKTLTDLPDEYLQAIGPVIKKVALATGVEQYNIVQNNGKLAFQHIDHVHFHVIPKPNETEGLVLTLGQNWPQKRVGAEELAATCENMKNRL